VSPASPAIIVKADEQDFADWIASERGFLEGLCTFEDDPLVLEPYQRTVLDFEVRPGKRPRFRWITKARQVGFSFLIGAEALARCHLGDHHRATVVSYNMADAKEKIVVARAIHEALPLAFQKPLITDSKTELAFGSATGKHGRMSRLVSHPSKAPRGKSGDVYLDELAHYMHDREVFTGATALVARSRGQLTACSTPLGRRGVFWEVATQEGRPYPRFQRFSVPWWLCTTFSTTPWAAMALAPNMTTEERVARFGTEAIREQFDALPLEDFQQEYECLFVDEAVAFYPHSLIGPCTSDYEVATDPSDVAKPKGRLTGGYDVGRANDRSVFTLFDEHRGTKRLVMKCVLHRVKFAAQEGVIRRALNLLPVASLKIDKTGIGANLAENLEDDYPQVEGVHFTNARKEVLANDFKVCLQGERIALPKDRTLVAQIHSVRRRITAQGNIVFDAERTRAGHADMFWSCALACEKDRTPRAGEVNVHIIGASA